MKKQMKLRSMYALLIAAATMIGITIYGSCSSDDDWEFDEESKYTRATLNDDFLDIKSTSYNEMEKEDLEIIGKAITRMTIKHENGLNFVQESKGSKLNMSEKLFDFIKNGFEHGNKLMQEKAHGTSNKKKYVPRRKSPTPEGNVHNCTGNDCVGHSISYYKGLNIEVVNNIINESLPSYPYLDVPCEDLEATLSLFGTFARQNYFFTSDDTFPHAVPGIILIPNHALNGTCVYLYEGNYYLFCYDDQMRKICFFQMETNLCAPTPCYVNTSLFGYYK